MTYILQDLRTDMKSERDQQVRQAGAATRTSGIRPLSHSFPISVSSHFGYFMFHGHPRLFGSADPKNRIEVIWRKYSPWIRRLDRLRFSWKRVEKRLAKEVCFQILDGWDVVLLTPHRQLSLSESRPKPPKSVGRSLINSPLHRSGEAAVFKMPERSC